MSAFLVIAGSFVLACLGIGALLITVRETCIDARIEENLARWIDDNPQIFTNLNKPTKK
jgi:hypothetical protein